MKLKDIKMNFLEKPNKIKVTSKLFNWVKGEDLYIPEMKLRVTWSELLNILVMN